MTASNKTELAVAALKNGTVIDHIPSDVLFKVVSLLGIEKMNTHVTIGSNLKSSRMGTKGIIKVADVEFPESTPQPYSDHCSYGQSERDTRL